MTSESCFLENIPVDSFANLFFYPKNYRSWLDSLCRVPVSKIVYVSDSILGFSPGGALPRTAMPVNGPHSVVSEECVSFLDANPVNLSLLQVSFFVKLSVY